MSNCPICSFPAKYLSEDDRLISNVKCYRCGSFKITDEAIEYFNDNYSFARQKNHLSSWIRENQSIILYERDIKRLSELRTPTVEEKAEKLLFHFIKKYPDPGLVIPDIISQLDLIFSKKGDPDILNAIKITEERIEFVLSSYAISWCSNPSEFRYLISEYLWRYKRVLNSHLPSEITPSGWDYFHSLQQRNLESNTAFIAMKFDEDLKKFSEEFVEKGITDAGFEPIRIDKYHHNNLIDDEIISNIKKSRFIIADFSFNNNGVYYEAGFARGLNIPVISLCEKKLFEDESNQVHFDTNHYSFLLYEKEKGDDLRNNIKLRIEATIGKGNFIKEIA